VDIATIIVLGKALLPRREVTPLRPPRERVEVTPPTSEAPSRPRCGLGEKAVFFQNPDRWLCVPEFK